MANAAFLLIFGILVLWLFTSGKLGAIVGTIKAKN